MAPTLLVLAAGMGSRYGGLKQIDPVGPSGETMLDYAVYDAIRAGFGRVVFIIRREFEGAFRDAVTPKYSGRIAADLVFQADDDLPAGCTAPGGRGRPRAAWTRPTCWLRSPSWRPEPPQRRVPPSWTRTRRSPASERE